MLRILCFLAALAPCAWSQSEPFVVHQTRPVIMNGPYLLAPAEDSVTVVWMTDTPCHSKVIYGTDALNREADNAEHGLLPIGLRHAVRVTGLDAGKTYRYRVVSTRVVKMKSYWPEKGLPVESPVSTFTTFDRAKSGFSFAAITDTHEDVARLAGLVKPVDWNSTDFLVHLGDAFHGIENEEAIWSKFLDPVAKALAFTKPLLYARGNHEARGPGARSLMDYVPIPEGRFYYARDHGPVHFVVLDTGEDKDDNTNVYARLNMFKRYREEELTWFDRHVRTDRRMSEAPFRVLLMHAPNWGWTDNQGAKWTEVANRGKFDLAISGHTHRFAHTPPGQKENQYHQLVIGPENLARVDASEKELKVVVTARDGAEIRSFTVVRRGP